MSKERTLERVEAEIAGGDLGKARDRLHGLIRTYPDDISLRSRLASIYWKLQYPHMAGCYWFLEENQNGARRVDWRLWMRQNVSVVLSFSSHSR